MVDGDGVGEEGFERGDHAEAGAEDWNEGESGGGDGFGCVGVAERGGVLCRGLVRSFGCCMLEGAHGAGFFNFQSTGKGFTADDCGDFVDESSGVFCIG